MDKKKKKHIIKDIIKNIGKERCEATKKYYQANREKRLQYSNEYYRTHTEARLKYSKSYRDSHPEKVTEWVSKQRKKRYENPDETKKQDRRRNLKRLYKISEEEYFNMKKKQSGVCPICNLHLDEIDSAAIDHNHKTGEIRSIVHKKCNFLIGWVETNLEHIPNVLNYLRGGIQ